MHNTNPTVLINPKSLRKIKRRDRWARYLISVGGIAIIATVFAIIALIVQVAIPLFREPVQELVLDVTLPDQLSGRPILALGTSEYLQTVYALTGDGKLVVLNHEANRVTSVVESPFGGSAARQPVAVESFGKNLHTVRWDNDSVSLIQVLFRPQFDASGVRTLEHQVKTLVEMDWQGSVRPENIWLRKSDKGFVRVAQTTGNRIEVLFQPEQGGDDPLFDAKISEPVRFDFVDPLGGTISAVAVSSLGNKIFLGTTDGTLVRLLFDDDGALQEKEILSKAVGSSVSAMGFVFGDVSLIVGDENGRLNSWFPVQTADKKRLNQITELEPASSAVTSISSGVRNKTIISQDRKGDLYIDYLTSARRLFQFSHPETIAAYSYPERGDGLFALTEEHLLLWKIDAPHPETSWKTLFRQVWYENYNEPAFVWQSTGGSDDFEPKMSVIPLVYGTIKATFYALLFALPISVLGAVYVSQFASSRFRAWIKPVIELMAALPSVVIGFLVALWLAPMFQDWIVAVLLTVILVPLFFLLFMLIWQFFRYQNWAKNVERGYEFIILVPVLTLAGWVAAVWSAPVENLLFAGSFSQWLYDSSGQMFDQRNSIIVAVGLGFAVIPIIFSITEDSISSVPRNLSAASLAVGASRWQTVWRVIVPSASPGIFAATMIGLGRAIGETMIVLMATGNTPIMDASPFNGMRTLSANIAVEVSEAPVGGTLYRTLFLCAVILFTLTIILNTAAELVRDNLRKKYGRF